MTAYSEWNESLRQILIIQSNEKCSCFIIDNKQKF